MTKTGILIVAGRSFNRIYVERAERVQRGL